MLRRRNNEYTYNQTQANQSPIRFERKNPTMSPGLSPMRCRTPTRANLSPFRNPNPNDNFRGHSPIKFVSHKPINPINAGFFRQQNSSNINSHYNQKYTTCVANNDHSVRRESYYETEVSSKLRNPYQNSQKMTVHDNKKLFSKLVSKLNSEKKKEPELVKKNTKVQYFKQIETNYEQKSTGPENKISKQKYQTETHKLQPMIDQIKAVQSVVYEEKQARPYPNQTNTRKGKENIVYYDEKNYKLKEQSQNHSTKSVGGIKSPDKKLKSEKKDLKIQNAVVVQNNVQAPSNKNKIKLQKERSPNNQKYENYHEPRRISEFPGANQNKQKQSFDDVRLYLDKLKDSYAYMGSNKDDSIGNNSQTYNNMNMSLMNMQPFI